MVAVVSRLGFDIGRWGIALGALSDPSFSEVDPFVVLLFGAEVKEVFVGFFFVVEGVYLHHILACVKLGFMDMDLGIIIGEEGGIPASAKPPAPNSKPSDTVPTPAVPVAVLAPAPASICIGPVSVFVSGRPAAN